MSASAKPLTNWIPPKRKPPLVQVREQNITDFLELFVNRLAYTRQSDDANLQTQRHYYYRPKDRITKRALELTREAIRRHLAGSITVGLYAIDPKTQRCKWIAIDADYDRAQYDLANLKAELRADGVEALHEMSRRGGHLWILCDKPVPASLARIYIYNLALGLGVPIKGTAGLRDGIEIFPRQDVLRPDEFGNALRGPLGVHRANCHRYWFYDAASNLDAQLTYLKHAKKLTEEDLQRFTAGMTIPEEFSRKATVEISAAPFAPNRREFRILDHVKVQPQQRSGNYWARCPSCAQAGNDRAGDNLAISVRDPRKYKCWAGCTKEDIRAALGCPIRQHRP